MLPLPISKTQLDKLGDRLRDETEASAADRDLLQAVLATYGEALQIVTAVLRERGFHPAGRLKITATIVEKLRRERSSSLKTIQDLAGARVVLDADPVEQDQVVREFCAALGQRGFSSVVIDRRMDPRSGYRAVHVVAKVDGIPVEVQFRTELQHLWAQIFERLADLWGRQIRYGGEPNRDGRPENAWELRKQMVADFLAFSQDIAITEAQFVENRIGVRAANDEVAAGEREVGSSRAEAVMGRRRAVGIVRKAFASMADVAEREARTR